MCTPHRNLRRWILNTTLALDVEKGAEERDKRVRVKFRVVVGLVSGAGRWKGEVGQQRRQHPPHTR